MDNPTKTWITRPSIATTSAIFLTLTGPVAAQNAEAVFSFDEGVRFENEGKIPEACDAFETSNRIEPRAGTLIRLGQCREKQGRRVSAWSAYKDSLTRVKDPNKKKLAYARIAALEPTLSYLTVSIADDSQVDGLVVARNGSTLDPTVWNHAVAVDAGTYTIVGSAPGHETWQATIEIAPSDKASVEVPHLKAIQAPIEQSPDPSIITPLIEVPDPRPVNSPSMFTHRCRAARAPSPRILARSTRRRCSPASASLRWAWPGSAWPPLSAAAS